MKKLIAIFLLLVSFLHENHAQDNYKRVIDSLKKELYKNHDSYKNIFLHYRISFVSMEQGDFLMAENYGIKAKQLALEFGRDSTLIMICEHMGNLKMTRGDYAGAIDEYQQGLRLVEKTDDRLRMSYLNNNIGVNHWYQGNIDEALKYYKKSYQLSEVIDDFDGMSGQLNNIGLIYRGKGDLETALKYYNLSLKLCKKVKNDAGYGNALNNIGIVMQMQKKFPEAIAVYEESLKLRRELGDQIGISTSLGNLGSVYAEMGNDPEAEKFFREAYELSESINDLEGIKELSYNLNELYERTGKPELAYFYFKKYISSRDSLNDDENKREAFQKEITFQFETEKIKMEKEREKEQIQKKEREKTQNIILVAVIAGSLLALLFAFFIFIKFRQTRKQNKIIEQQKHLVEEKQKEIIDSITYAQRLQQAILVPENEIQKHFPDSFLFYLPKDIVAGDFYFFELTDTHIFYAAADCTGHGVPGAMMSIVCSNALTKSVKEFALTDPGKILDKARELILETFERSGQDVKDGMDISFISVNRKTNQFQWAGANNPLWYIEKNEITEMKAGSTIGNPVLESFDKAYRLVEVKADKQPIGKTDNPKPFTTHTVSNSANNVTDIFLFTDGFADQFGGPKGKKFKYSSLQKLLLGFLQEDTKTINQGLKKAFSDWKGGLEQIDDVCVIGIRI